MGSVVAALGVSYSMTGGILLAQGLNICLLHWQTDPTPVLLPGKSHGQRSLEGCSPWGHKGLDTNEATELNTQNQIEVQT